MKKEPAKKGKKGTKKKESKANDSKADEAGEEGAEADATKADAPNEGDADDAPAVEDEADAEKAAEPSASASQQSKERSESFRQGNGPQAEVQELYRKQAARIEELEAENKTLKESSEQSTTRLSTVEEELESLREGSSDVAELRTKAKEADRLSTELTSVQRQLAQAQQASKGSTRRQSSTSPDVSEQLASKTSTIESLELDISNLRNQITELQATVAERDTSTKELEDRAQAAEASTESVKQELDALKVSISFPSNETQEANEDPAALTKRITVLESDLRTANTNLEAAATKATSLEQKIEALTKLHRDATALSQTKDKELVDLRSQLKRRDRPSHVRDASDFELGEEETESGALQARLRALEAENFDLRRGVWRDKRAEMQTGMDDADGNSRQDYEDVDLNGPYTPYGKRGSLPRQTSTFQDVITSGINAFTGRPREGATPGRDRAVSESLLSDVDDFDEEAFRLAQEEEAKQRIERIKEVKRGLEQWRGWRVDLAEMRKSGLGNGREVGPVFEV